MKDRLLAIELAYNLHDALKRFAALSDCRLFAAVLEEKLPMEIYEDQRNMIERVQVSEMNCCIISFSLLIYIFLCRMK